MDMASLALSRAPGARPILHAIYRVIAANRHCIGGVCKIPRRRAWRDWHPLLLLPVLAIAVRETLPAWVFMWLIAFAIYAGFKWLTYRDTLVQGMVVRVSTRLIYLLFLARDVPKRIRWGASREEANGLGSNVDRSHN